MSDADELYPKFLGLQMFGVILGKSSYINIMPAYKRFNLYVALVGKSFFARKNITQDKFKEIYPIELILPNESSAEKFLKNLGKLPNGIWMNGEFSKILKHINKGGYLSTIVETLNDLHNYEHPIFTRDIMKETITIHEPYPTFNTTVTPETLSEQVNAEMLEGGFFSKIILVPGTSRETGRSEIPQEALDIKKEIIDTLSPLFYESINIEFRLDKEALERFNEIEREAIVDSKVRSVAGRYAEDVVILAGLLRFGEMIEATKNSDNSVKSKKSNNSNNSNTISFINTTTTIITKITPENLNEAFEMVKPCIEFVGDLHAFISMNKKYIIKMKNYVEENYPVHRSKVARMCNLDARECQIAEDTLGKTHDILKVISFRGKRKDGINTRMQYVYCVTDPDESKCKECIYKEYCKEAK